MDLSSEQLLEQREGSLHLDADDEPTTLEIQGRDGVRSYALTETSLSRLEAAAHSLEGYRPSNKTSDDYVRILASFMPKDEATRLVSRESIGTVIRTMRGLVARAHAAMETASATPEEVGG